MEPGLFVVGVVTGLLLSLLREGEVPCEPQPSPGPRPFNPMDPMASEMGSKRDMVAEASATFLPYMQGQIDEVKAGRPSVSWSEVVARIPYLTEAVAMYYAMEDPKVPMTPKLSIAAALLYAPMPVDLIPDAIPILGQADDLGVLLTALNLVYSHINAQHLAKAKAWLQAHGVEPNPLFQLGKDLSQTPGNVIPAPSFQRTRPGARQAPGLPGPAPSMPDQFGGSHVRERIVDPQPPAPPPVWR